MFKNLDPHALGLSASQSETIELALSFGFRGISFNLVDFAGEVQSYGLPKARRLLDSAKLTLGLFALPLDFEADDARFRAELARLAELSELAASVGATRAVTVIEPASDERPYHQNFEFYRQRLGEVGQMLAPHGVRLGVGFESSDAARRDKHFEFIHDLDALLVLLSTVGQSNVGLSLDVWHVWAAGGSLDAVSKKLKADQIIAVALADAAQPDATQPDATQPEGGDPHDAATRLLPGETRVIDSAAALSMLADLDYDGPVTPLPDRSRFAGMRRDAIAKLAGEKLDAVWQAAGLKHASGQSRSQDAGTRVQGPGIRGASTR